MWSINTQCKEIENVPQTDYMTEIINIEWVVVD